MEPGSLTRITSREIQALDLSQQVPSGISITLGSQETPIFEYLRTLQKRKWLVFASTIIVTVVVALGTLRMTPLYEAVGRVAINRENPDILGFKDNPNVAPEAWDTELDTQVKILQSDTLALHAARQLQQNGLIPAEATAGAVSFNARDDAAHQARLLGIVQGGLLVSVIPKTRIIEIRYMHPDKRFAATVVNTLINTYIEQNFKTKYESTMQASDWLSKQLAELQIKVESSQQKLVDYQKNAGIVGIDEKQNIITEKLDDLNRQLTAAEADRIQKEATYRLANSGNPDLVPGSAPNGVLEKLRGQEADLRLQYAQATVQFGPHYPKVVELNNQLKQVQAAIQAENKKAVERVQNEYLAAVQREKMLRVAFDEQKREANRLNESAIQFNLLKRDLETNRQLYEGLLQKLKEAGISASLKSSNLRIVDLARTPLAPARPNVPLNIAVGFFVGLLGGVGLAFVLEALDNTIHTPEEAQMISACPTLAMIPLDAMPQVDGRNHKRKKLPQRFEPNHGSVGLTVHSRPKSQMAEAYRSLRTSLLLSSAGGPPKVVLITSALPQEGKTTTSLNCALSLAQRGGRVLLVDADLRRPGIHKTIGIPSGVGLSTLLAGNGSWEEMLKPSPQLPNLFVLPAGPPPPNSAELLGSPQMRELIMQWRESFEHVVIDTPPALTVTDAVLLSIQADAVLLVVRSGQTPKDALRRARELLAHVNATLTGVVVNAVDLRSPDYYYYYYGGKYGYKYGSGYYHEDSHKG